jgi:hypothetical protein
VTGHVGVSIPLWLRRMATVGVQIGDRSGPAEELIAVVPGHCRVLVRTTCTAYPGIVASGVLTVSVVVPDGSVCWIRPLGSTSTGCCRPPAAQDPLLHGDHELGTPPGGGGRRDDLALENLPGGPWVRASTSQTGRGYS